MYYQSQLICKLALGTFLMLWAQSAAEIIRDDASPYLMHNDLTHVDKRQILRHALQRLRWGRSIDAPSEADKAEIEKRHIHHHHHHALRRLLRWGRSIDAPSVADKAEIVKRHIHNHNRYRRLRCGRSIDVPSVADKAEIVKRHIHNHNPYRRLRCGRSIAESSEPKE